MGGEMRGRKELPDKDLRRVNKGRGRPHCELLGGDNGGGGVPDRDLWGYDEGGGGMPNRETRGEGGAGGERSGACQTGSY